MIPVVFALLRAGNHTGIFYHKEWGLSMGARPHKASARGKATGALFFLLDQRNLLALRPKQRDRMLRAP